MNVLCEVTHSFVLFSSKHFFIQSSLISNLIHLITFTCKYIYVDLLGVYEAEASADIGYFYGAVSVGGESG